MEIHFLRVVKYSVVSFNPPMTFFEVRKSSHSFRLSFSTLIGEAPITSNFARIPSLYHASLITGASLSANYVFPPPGGPIIKTFINPHPINFSMEVAHDKAGKEAIMAVYASPNGENNYPERDCAEQGPHLVTGAQGWRCP